MTCQRSPAGKQNTQDLNFRLSFLQTQYYPLFIHCYCYGGSAASSGRPEALGLTFKAFKGSKQTSPIIYSLTSTVS